MFRTVFPSIIRSSRLYIQQQAYVKQILLTLHVSDDLSVHHQEFKTVHRATGICQTDTADCLLASNQQCLFDICLLLYVQS